MTSRRSSGKTHPPTSGWLTDSEASLPTERTASPSAGVPSSIKSVVSERVRSFRMRVEEPDPGRVLTECDERSSIVTTWVVTPEGLGCRVRLETRWQGAGGLVGCSSGCSRRGCCGGCTRMSWSGWTAMPARRRPPERPAGPADGPGRHRVQASGHSQVALGGEPSVHLSLSGWGWSGHAWPMPMPTPVPMPVPVGARR
jgi:hypothetical protein